MLVEMEAVLTPKQALLVTTTLGLIDGFTVTVTVKLFPGQIPEVGITV